MSRDDIEELAAATEFDVETLQSMSDEQIASLVQTLEGFERRPAQSSDGDVAAPNATGAGPPTVSGDATTDGGPDGGGTAASTGAATSPARETQSSPNEIAVAGESGGTLLEARDLEVAYGQVTALKGLDMHVERGELVSLIGPNGAGKTTFSDTATGFLDYGGSLRYNGTEIREIPQQELVSSGIIYCSEERNLFGYMSVEDNLRLGAYLQDEETVQQNLQFVYDLFPRLEERTDQNARSMSGGEQQMLAIGRALMGEPDLLILDEPTLGLAPVILDDISRALGPIRDQGVSILLTEQNVTFALDHADRIYLLENGDVVREGTPEQLRGDDYIRESYLGG